MVGITVQSGDVPSKQQTEQTARTPSQPLNVLVLGDFSGRQSHGLIKPETLGERKIYRLDKDSFDEVFTKLNVSLKLPITEQPIAFREFDQLHPDHLYEHIELFARYRQLLRQLGSTAQYETAVRALTEEGIIQPVNTPVDGSVYDKDRASDKSDPSPHKAAGPANLLDDLLSDSQSAQQSTFDVAALIRQTVAPYVQPKQDPKAKEYKAALEHALSDVMRKVMHISAFKNLEATWRSLDLLNRQLDTDREVHLHILDVCKQELIEDGQNAMDDPGHSRLGRRLFDQVGVRGAEKIDCILLDAQLSTDAVDAGLVRYLSQLTQRLGARLLLGASARLVGNNSFVDFAEEQERKYSGLSSDVWQTLRNEDFTRNTYIAAPRFLLRLPYGKRTNPIDAFAYEELPQNGAHSSYLWGNGAYLLVTGLLQTMQRARHRGKFDGTWAYIERMPLHVYRDQDNEECVTPCAEVFLTARLVAQLEESGLTVLQSVKNNDQILIERWVPFGRTA